MLPLDRKRLRLHLNLSTTRHRINLPDAPIAHEGFFTAHFFTVSDQDKSKDFYVRILGGKVIKPDNPCYIKLASDYPVASASPNGLWLLWLVSSSSNLLILG